jgi:hypothetical protein
MRKIMIPTVLAAMGFAILNANAQTGPRPQSPSQSQPPAQSAQPSETTGRALPQAPTGHRQPRATDVPDQGLKTMGPREMDIDRQLKICRNC